MLQHVSRFFLTDATLKAANAVVVNFHHRLGFSGLWGTGSISSSHGQRFGIQASSLLASSFCSPAGWLPLAPVGPTVQQAERDQGRTETVDAAPTSFSSASPTDRQLIEWPRL
jgi:Tn3 transposase DDE domain-containing protein